MVNNLQDLIHVSSADIYSSFYCIFYVHLQLILKELLSGNKCASAMVTPHRIVLISEVYSSLNQFHKLWNFKFTN